MGGRLVEYCGSYGLVVWYVMIDLVGDLLEDKGTSQFSKLAFENMVAGLYLSAV